MEVIQTASEIFILPDKKGLIPKVRDETLLFNMGKAI